MLPGLESREDVEREIIRLEIDAEKYDEISSWLQEPNRYLFMVKRLRTNIIPELKHLLNFEEYK